MSQGKYSPDCPHANDDDYKYEYNSYGKQLPWDNAAPYIDSLNFHDYDDEGYDRYGYSCFDTDGEYVGLGNGVDRNGFTELEYLGMDQDVFLNYC